MWRYRAKGDRALCEIYWVCNGGCGSVTTRVCDEIIV